MSSAFEGLLFGVTATEPGSFPPAAAVLLALAAAAYNPAQRATRVDPDGGVEIRMIDYRKTPLHLVAEKNERKIAEELLKGGANIEARTTCGVCPRSNGQQTRAAMMSWTCS